MPEEDSSALKLYLVFKAKCRNKCEIISFLTVRSVSASWSRRHEQLMIVSSLVISL